MRAMTGLAGRAAGASGLPDAAAGREEAGWEEAGRGGAGRGGAGPGPLPFAMPAEADGGLAMLHVPPGWRRGCPAALLFDGEGARDGHARPRLAALLDAGLLVLVLPSGALRSATGSGPGRVDAGLALLREGLGAGSVAALWRVGPAARA